MTATAEIKTEVNGVDVPQLTGIIDGIVAAPDLGRCQF